VTYVFTEKADEVLSKILSAGVEEYGVNAAIIYYQSIIEKCQSTAENPFQYAAIDGIYPNCRRVISGAHSIYYRIESDDIVIGRVLRVEMDFTRHI
jgi:toxin ParE1/3/4